MSAEQEIERKSGKPLLLFFVFAGIGTVCLCGLLVLGYFGNRHIDLCFDETSDTYIQDLERRAEVCG